MRRRTRITSIKPGRGPSFMGGIGSLVMVLFGLFWTAMAIQITKDAPFDGVGVMFPLFGVLFVIMGIANAVYSFKNATAKKRYSLLDITDSDTEPDPLNEQFGENAPAGAPESTPEDAPESVEFGRDEAGDQPHRFCPYCGKDLDSDFRFCPSCGREIPE
ncbi:MAG: zinc ribbon domain-containing protein [Bacillota bacterium]